VSIEIIKSPLVIRKKLKQYLNSWIWFGKGNNDLIYGRYSESNRACDININKCPGFDNHVSEIPTPTRGYIRRGGQTEYFLDIDYETVGDILESRLIEKEYECGCGRTHPANFNSSNVIYHAFGARGWEINIGTFWNYHSSRPASDRSDVWNNFKKKRKTVSSKRHIFMVRCPKPHRNDEDLVTFIKITPERVRVNVGQRQKPSKLLRLESLWSCSYENLCGWDVSLNSTEKKTVSPTLFNNLGSLYLISISVGIFFLILKVLDLNIYYDIALTFFLFFTLVPSSMMPYDLDRGRYEIGDFWSDHRVPSHPKIYLDILKQDLLDLADRYYMLLICMFLMVIFIGIYIGYTESFGFSETYNRFLEIYNRFLDKD
ncbi:uncharacterized protein METZ01_LOCUS274850, partial [marine metagenome]